MLNLNLNLNPLHVLGRLGACCLGLWRHQGPAAPHLCSARSIAACSCCNFSPADTPRSLVHAPHSHGQRLSSHPSHPLTHTTQSWSTSLGSATPPSWGARPSWATSGCRASQSGAARSACVIVCDCVCVFLTCGANPVFLGGHTILSYFGVQSQSVWCVARHACLPGVAAIHVLVRAQGASRGSHHTKSPTLIQGQHRNRVGLCCGFFHNLLGESI